MATFSFNDYQNAVQAAQSRASGASNNQGASNGAKVGWFKLSEDGAEALVRINISDVSDMQFASIHQLGASANWMKINCLHELGSSTNNCPFCAAAASGNTAIGKPSKRVYVPMMVSYKDAATGQWSAPIAVVWDRPAGFSRELANKLQSYGDLRNNLFKITRNGAKNEKNTTYSFDYAVPAIFKPELIPADFSAFENFRVDKHSFWVKSLEEMNQFLATGAFPEVVKNQAQQAAPATAQAPVAAPQTAPAPAVQAAAPQVAPQAAPTFEQTPDVPLTNQFTNFTF